VVTKHCPRCPLTSTFIEIPIDGAGSGGFEVTGRGGTEGNLAMDKGEGRVVMVLGSAEGAERDTD